MKRLQIEFDDASAAKFQRMQDQLGCSVGETIAIALLVLEAGIAQSPDAVAEFRAAYDLEKSRAN